ncbi:hypothetical protein [Clostridium saccharoperbutylacetonicum]|uniref:hypothetical protein n=1 Tax=Clostridium saccharoperbutylacetonicum TaxID=36745 RepID=UPI00098399C5|nr:hypothetical protein [Clostridium saccharoperbutylacetonicum]AQR95552.1 hypothetical protein CLSAP_28680 [Clostridium saccharoperbutylacetonicum]NSB31412.1 hypothetical protein [Clostridium saccharoperbutylacetonicum]
MNNYYQNNGWDIHEGYQPMSKTIYRAIPDARYELEAGGAEQQDLGNGFFRYLWVPAQEGNTPIRIRPSRYLDFRLNARPGQQVISAGFATDPLEDISIVQIWPRHPHVMAILLHSGERSSSASTIDLWLIVKSM